MLKSNVRRLAIEKGFASRQELSYSCRLTHTTIAKVWSPDCDMSKTMLNTLIKLAGALGCRIEDLYKVEKGSKND